MNIPVELVDKISHTEWFESKNSPLGTPFYPNRPSKGEVEGVPGIMPPKILLKKNCDTEEIEVYKINYTP